jgi:hypothetical protein
MDTCVIDTKADDWSNDDKFLCAVRQDGVKVVRIDHPHASPDSCDLLIIPNAHQ